MELEKKGKIGQNTTCLEKLLLPASLRGLCVPHFQVPLPCGAAW